MTKALRTYSIKGTGKTFTAIQITKILLENKKLRQNKPIMFVCQTNHALDQMLGHIYKFQPVGDMQYLYPC